jgi:hypothetical protein
MRVAEGPATIVAMIKENAECQPRFDRLLQDKNHAAAAAAAAAGSVPGCRHSQQAPRQIATEQQNSTAQTRQMARQAAAR